MSVVGTYNNSIIWSMDGVRPNGCFPITVSFVISVEIRPMVLQTFPVILKAPDRDTDTRQSPGLESRSQKGPSSLHFRS